MRNSELSSAFAAFAREQAHGVSPRYERLALAVADRPVLGAALLAAPEPLRAPDLLFGAAQYVVRGEAAGHPLGAYLPTLGGFREPGDGLVEAFASLADEYGHALARVCATRSVQSNEASRCAVLRPALGLAAQLVGGPLALVELGTSAGLLLLPDRYGYVYKGPTEFRCGRVDAPPRLVFDCKVRGPGYPEGLDVEPDVAARVGIDVAPLDADDPDDVRWLRAAVWPEHIARLGRLDAALDEVRNVRPELRRGHAGELIGPVLEEVEPGLVPCVIATNVLGYLPADELTAVLRCLDMYGRDRDLLVVLNDLPSRGAARFAPPSADYLDSARAAGALTLVAYTGGVPSVEMLGRSGAFGSSIEWAPRSYRYALDLGAS
jgi:hypothetical protein